MISIKTILPVAKKGARNSQKSSHTKTDREAWCTPAGGRGGGRSREDEILEDWGRKKKQPEDESWCTETPIKNDSHWKTRQHTERKRRDCRKIGKAKVIARISIRRGKEMWRANNAGEIELDDEEHEQDKSREMESQKKGSLKENKQLLRMADESTINATSITGQRKTTFLKPMKAKK